MLIRLAAILLMYWAYACTPKPSSNSPQTTTSEQSPTACETETIVQHVNTIATNISNQELAYNSLPYTDCSGIFHRVMDSLNLRCPEYAYPSKQVRDSRALARWYHQQGNMTLVHDALNMDKLIVPGAVMFYGGRGANLGNDFSIESITQSGGVNHVGIVTFVKKNAEGIVENYHLFHGLRPGKPAQITSYHRRTPSRETYPPYGNGSEPWLAIAPVVSH